MPDLYGYRQKLYFGHWDGGWQVVRRGRPVDHVMAECSCEVDAQTVAAALNRMAAEDRRAA